LLNFNENYITVLFMNFSYCYNVLPTELEDLGHAMIMGVQD